MPALTSIVLGTLAAGSLLESRKARKDTKRARKVDEKRGRLQAQRGAIEQVRQSQIAAASVTQAGENQGVGGSSAVVSGASTIKNRAFGNVAFAEQIFGLQQSASRLRSSAAGHAGRSQAFGTLASIGSGFGSPSSGPAPVSTATPV